MHGISVPRLFRKGLVALCIVDANTTYGHFLHIHSLYRDFITSFLVFVVVVDDLILEVFYHITYLQFALVDKSFK